MAYYDILSILFFGSASISLLIFTITDSARSYYEYKSEKSKNKISLLTSYIYISFSPKLKEIGYLPISFNL